MTALNLKLEVALASTNGVFKFAGSDRNLLLLESRTRMYEIFNRVMVDDRPNLGNHLALYILMTNSISRSESELEVCGDIGQGLECP